MSRLGSEHGVEYIDIELYCYTFEIYIILLANVISVNIINIK